MLSRSLPAGFIAPCLPTKTTKLPSGGEWLHEIKHDGFRIIARKDGERVRLYSRPGNDLTRRFPLIVETLARLRSRSCIIDGEAVACDDNGIALFDLIRHHRANDRVFLFAFDLIELNGDDLRRDPLQVRKATLASLVAKSRPGIRLGRCSEGCPPGLSSGASSVAGQGHQPAHTYICGVITAGTAQAGENPKWLNRTAWPSYTTNLRKHLLMSSRRRAKEFLLVGE